MPALPSLAVKPTRQFPFFARHPWVHRASLVDIDPQLPCGAVVDLTTHDGTWIARGLYNPHSNLRVRLYSWDREQSLDNTFFVDRIRQAIARRRWLCSDDDPLQAMRLVYSEADGISGLIVDRYANALVVQVTAAAIEPYLSPILDALQEDLKPAAIFLRTDSKLQTAEQFTCTPGMVRGELTTEAAHTYRQNDLLWQVDLLHGQKTGAYLDQRDNHAAAARYARGQSVLDVCCHTGGFSLVAARHGAASVLGIDSSDNALEVARSNALNNGIDNATFQSGDCFQTVKQLADQKQQFGMVILDPPRLAGSRNQLDAAMRAYYRLNRSAVDLLPSGGVLVTCSCSGRVTRADFLNMLVDVGQKARRDIIVLENRGAPLDHPMRVSCPESDYLKCLICEVR